MEAAKIIKRVCGALGFPLAHIFYDTCGCKKEKPDTYFTYQLLAGVGVAFADDENTATETTWRVDLYAKDDYTALLPRVIKAFKDAGFYGVTVEAELYETDTRYCHVPIEIKFLLEE